MPSRESQEKILAFLLANSTGKFTAQEIADGIGIHVTNVRRNLRTHIVGIVQDTEYRSGVTRRAEQYYYDGEVAAATVKAYNASEASNTNTKKGGNKKVKHNDLVAFSYEVVGITKIERDLVINSLKTPSLTVQQLRERLDRGIAAMNADEDQSDANILEWLVVISASSLQHTINYRKSR